MRWLILRLIFYPTLAWNFLLGRVLRIRPWFSHVDSHVIIGALPFAFDVPKLKELGVCGVINTCEEYPGPQAAYNKAAMEQLYLPTVDFTAPSLEHIEQGVKFIEKHAQAGNLVYVHCKAGRGRSATVVICWLIAQGMTPEQAQEYLVQKRSHVNRSVYLRSVVREFYDRRLKGTQ